MHEGARNQARLGDWGPASERDRMKLNANGWLSVANDRSRRDFVARGTPCRSQRAKFDVDFAFGFGFRNLGKTAIVRVRAGQLTTARKVGLQQPSDDPKCVKDDQKRMKRRDIVREIRAKSCAATTKRPVNFRGSRFRDGRQFTREGHSPSVPLEQILKQDEANRTSTT